jgi:predicted GIY-YIG superfamily endonuclease
MTWIARSASDTLSTLGLRRRYFHRSLRVIASAAKQSRAKERLGALARVLQDIVASRRNGTLYTGVTSNLPKRAFEHREGLVAGFSRKHGRKLLVLYELHDSMIEAITREKQIKAGSRAKKLALIETINPGWKDLYGDPI